MMGEYFKGWRRKVGVVTLLIACVFMAAWGRGQSGKAADDIRVPVGENTEYGVMLLAKRIHVLKYQTFQDGNRRATGAQTIAKVSYWSLIIPLTALSAYLLLSNPRKSISRKTAESIPDKVA